METRIRQQETLPWPRYRVGWRRPTRYGSDDWQRTMVVRRGPPTWVTPRPDDGARVYDALTPVALMLVSSCVFVLALYGAITLARELWGG